LEGLIDGGAIEPVIPGRDRQIYKLIREGRTYFVKHYTTLTVKSRLQVLLRRSKAHKAWRFAQRLRQRSILTPNVIAFLQGGSWWRKPELYLVTEGIDGQTLREMVRASLPLASRRGLIRAVAIFLAQLHDAGIYHGDFSAFNIIVEQDVQAPHGWLIYLIDLDAIRAANGISHRRQIKNLDELGRNFTRLAEVSTRERLRFLACYAGARKRLHLPLALLKNEVCQRTAQRMQTYGKRFISSSAEG
jgi:tRNA A-37 threonylcarbamoyl transferase component Bud32